MFGFSSRLLQCVVQFSESESHRVLHPLLHQLCSNALHPILHRQDTLVSALGHTAGDDSGSVV